MNLELIVSSAVAGLFAGFSPCTLPVYPVILNIVTSDRNRTRLPAVAFSAGLAVAFTVFYLAVGFAMKYVGEAAGQAIEAIYVFLYASASIICILLAAQTLGKFSIYAGAFTTGFKVRGGLLGAFLAGAFFATTVSPCNVGFIVAAIMPVLLAKTTVLEGLTYMFIFSFSMSTPMLIIGLLSGHVINSWFIKHIKAVETASALFLAAAGVYFAYSSAVMVGVL